MSNRGKKVLDITWEHEGVTIKIPVKAFTERDSETGKDKMVFRAEWKDAGIEEKSTDINVIKQNVEKKLKEWYTIDWTLHLLVTVDGSDHGYRGASFNIGFKTEFCVIGKDSRGTTRSMCVPHPEKLPASPEHVNVTRWAGENPFDGLPKTGKQVKDTYGHTGKHGTTTALVKATPENVLAADNFVKAMERLLLNMHDYFSPEKVELTLAKASQMLLPAPK